MRRKKRDNGGSNGDKNERRGSWDEGRRGLTLGVIRKGN